MVKLREKNKTIDIDGYVVEVQFKKMKNIYLRIKPDGKITVSAPIGTSKKYLMKFLQERKGWIDNALKKIKQSQVNTIQLEKNETLIFAQPTDALYSDVVLERLLDEQIAIFINQYWDFFAKRNCHKPALKYRKMKSTWGVCRPTINTITFNRRLVHQPLDFVEYVVVHELCHLLVANHSRDFWRLVVTLMPDYRAREKMWIIVPK